MKESDRAPIACALSPGEYAERLAWIEALNVSLLSYALRGLTLELHYPPEELSRVRELVRREGSCCAFLSFEIEESATSTVLRVHAPEETRDSIGAILAPFLSGIREDTDGDAGRPLGLAMSGPELVSLVTCPACGHQERLVMPTNACVFFHHCSGCGVLIRPQRGDCCVFCSYGTVACPPMQTDGGCCASGEPTNTSTPSER